MVPNLIHPVNVTILPLNESATVYDRDAREPVGQVAVSATVTIKAQVAWRVPMDPKWEAMGPVEDVRGYLLFRYLDLTAAGYSPKLGDMITKIGHVDTLVFMTQLQDAGHYPDQNGATMRMAYFGDRRPSTALPEM